MASLESIKANFALKEGLFNSFNSFFDTNFTFTISTCVPSFVNFGSKVQPLERTVCVFLTNALLYYKSSPQKFSKAHKLKAHNNLKILQYNQNN